LLFRIFIEIYADGYDEKYRGDADDRAWLKTLSERQREAELLKRHEQREILKHRYKKLDLKFYKIYFLIYLREEISKKLKSKNEESKLESDDDDEIQTKSNTLDNDIYAEDDEDDYRSSANRRKQVNATKQKDTQHSKSLQALLDERKKKQGKSVNRV
jgi:hypothetical protein